ncbi:MAG: 4Fe-4S dicluster domain-containing protein [Chloroflexi bacterium]|nr:4Fe-4S dicluster domain-containing protein [Chloroflexota bacterium]
MPRYGMVVDLDRCTGCRACVEACKVENNTPAANLWMYVFRFEEGDYPDTRIWFMPRPCQHCDNAPCVKVCPVGARFKRTDGLVSTDWERCIGCRYCEVSCPYGVNYFNWQSPAHNYYLDWDDPDLKPVTNGQVPPYRNPDLDKPYGKEQRRIAGGGRVKGVIEKCTFCVQRVEQGLVPASVANCPVFALQFGDLDDPDSIASRVLRSKPSFRLLEEAGTQPRVHYVSGRPPTGEARQIEAVRARV